MPTELLSAFRLGFRSRQAYWFLSQASSDSGAITELVSLCNSMDRCMRALGSVIDKQGYGDACSVISKFKKYAHSTSPLETDAFDPVIAQKNWRLVETEVDHALRQPKDIRAWYILGCGLGQTMELVWSLLRAHVPTSHWAHRRPISLIAPDEGAVRPELAPLIRRATDHLNEVIEQVRGVWVAIKQSRTTKPSNDQDGRRRECGRYVPVHMLPRQRLSMLRFRSQLSALEIEIRRTLSREVRPHIEMDAATQSASKASSRPLSQGVIRAKALEARDKWIYEQCCKLVPYQDIADELGAKKEQWKKIGSPQGIIRAAKKYAKRHGLLPPPPRRSERITATRKPQ